MSRRRTRPSPTESATDFPLHHERVGGDGKYWHVSEDKRGVRRWKKGLYHGPLSSTTESFIKDELSGVTMETEDRHGGLDGLFDRDSPTLEEEPTPEEVVEVEKDTVMSKLRGSVNVPEEFKFADDMTFYTMLRNIFRGKNILITGPSGCGKSSLGKILADITAKDFYSFNFGDSMNPSAKLLGDTKYDKESGTWFKPSRFVNAIQGDSFIMLDEVTRDRTGDLANILMPVLDGQKYLALDESEDADTVSVSKGAFFYATANIGREYLGASHDLDRAWKDRFTGGIYELEYLPPQKEKELIQNRNPQLSDYDADKIVDFAKRVRDLYASDELNTAVSTRMCLASAELVVDGMPLVDALKHTCLPFYPVQGGDDTERVRIIQVIQSMGE
jgi:MoxR-like ATPase